MAYLGDRNLLNEIYVAQRLKKIEMIHESISVMSPLTQNKLILEQVQKLLEGINPQQFKAYLGWFKQIKTFLKQYKLPALRHGIETAQDEIQDLLRGSEKAGATGITGFLKKIAAVGGEKGQAISRSGASDLKRLNDVNHFLWGITTFISKIPLIMSAIDDRLDGKLLGESVINEKTMSMMNAPASTQEPSGPPESNSGTESNSGNVDDSLFNKIKTIGGSKGGKYIDDFRKLMMGTMKQSIKNFSAAGIPFIDAKKVINDILKLKISEINDLAAAASDLSDKWNNIKSQVVDDVKTLDQASDKAQQADASGQTENPTEQVENAFSIKDNEEFIDTLELVANASGKNAQMNIEHLLDQISKRDFDPDHQVRLAKVMRKLKLEGRLKKQQMPLLS